MPNDIFDDIFEPKDSFFDTLYLSSDYPESKLLNALEEKNYNKIYSLLPKLEAPLHGEIAEKCCRAALQCSLRAMKEVLDHCQFNETGRYLPKRTRGGIIIPYDLLPAMAAAGGRLDILDLLLSRGYSPNAAGNYPAPIFAAAKEGNLHCVGRLLQEPGLDTAMTTEILMLWAAGDNDNTVLDWCLESMAPRFLGREKGLLEPLPIPDKMRLAYMAPYQNLKLARRFCTERDVDPDDACNFLSALPYGGLDVNELSQLLAAFFTACPTLLRRGLPRCVLAACALAAEKDVPRVLRPWLEKLSGKRIPLLNHPAFDWVAELPNGTAMPKDGAAFLGGKQHGGLLNRWEQRLGPKLIPVLDRRNSLPLRSYIPLGFDGSSAEAISDWERKSAAELLSRCGVVGKPRPGKLSVLAIQALALLSGKALIQQLEPGGVLAGEDPALLIQYAQKEARSREKRNLLLTHVKSGNCYEL